MHTLEEEIGEVVNFLFSSSIIVKQGEETMPAASGGERQRRKSDDSPGFLDSISVVGTFRKRARVVTMMGKGMTKVARSNLG